MNSFKNFYSLAILFILTLSTSLYAQDPGEPGVFGFEKLEYDLGVNFQPSDYEDAMVEVRASVHRPVASSPDPFPLIVFLHGRHPTCYDVGSTGGQLRFPCNPGQLEIPNFEGYDYIAELLASQGNIVISISSNGILGTSGTSDFPDDSNMLARAELIQHHLNLWNGFNTNSDGPFGSDFIGQVDIENIITVGHSRGGEGVVRHFEYNESIASPFKVKGVFAIAPTSFLKTNAEGMNLATLLPYCDGDLARLQGLFYYDEQRYEFENTTGELYNMLMMGANHNFYNTVWTPGEFPAGTSDDWSNRDDDQDNPYCGTSVSTTRFSPEKQRNSIKPFIAAFVQKYTRGGNAVIDDILRGVDPQPPASSTLNPEDIHLSYQAQEVERRDINRIDIASNSTLNTAGGNVTSSGLSLYEVCGEDNARCGEQTNLDNHFSNGNGGQRSLGRIRIDWNSPNGWVRNDIPEIERDMSDLTHLTFRASTHVNTGATFINLEDQNFTIEITDGSSTTAQILVGDYTKALFLPQGDSPSGEEDGFLPRSINNTIAVPLSVFDGLDISDIASFRFIFNQTSQGSLLISDIAFTSYVCIPGRACNDGDSCTTGETYDTDCNCTGGIPSTNDSDNDGVCDEFDICEGGDDSVDTDFDGIPDFCDPCPLFPDTDGDGFCDDVDICEGGDDSIDTDNDGSPDFCDICPNDPQDFCLPDDYCEANESSGLFGFIDSVTIATTTNTSGEDEDGFGNFIDPSITVTANETHNLTIIFGDGLGAGLRMSVWMDFNRNAILEDSEIVYSNDERSFETVNTTFTVPEDASNGLALVRFVGSSSNTTGPTACGSFNFGETEDYSILIQGGTVQEDTELPNAICQDIIVTLNPNGIATITSNQVDGGSTDNIGIVSRSIDINSFDCDDIGMQLVTLTVTDEAGNVDSCQATVTVQDNTAPIISCPDTITVTADETTNTYVLPDYFAEELATVTDNCSNPVSITSQTPVPGETLVPGTYSINLVAADSSGNEIDCSFELVVDELLSIDGQTLSDKSILLYPNPANNSFTVLNKNNLYLDTIAIYDISGRLVNTVIVRKNDSQIAIDISKLAVATYIIIISNENESLIKQLIKY